MKIFFACAKSPNETFLPESTLWHDNLCNGLVSLGHEIIKFDFDLSETIKRQNPAAGENQRFIRRNRPRVVKELLEQIIHENTKSKVDVFFSYFSNACITKEALKKLRDMGIITINWFCNASYQLHLVNEIAPCYNYCLVPEKFRLDDYRRLGANPIYCQEASDPHKYRPHHVPYQYDVTFVGQGYGERPELVKYLLDHDISIRVWGPRWELYSQQYYQKRWMMGQRPLNKIKNQLSPHRLLRKIRSMLLPPANRKLSTPTAAKTVLPDYIIGSPLSDQEMIRMYSLSKINLGFSSCATDPGDPRILQVRLRDFEVPMSGGFYLVEYIPELEDFFEQGKEIVFYHDKKDLVKKIKYFLSHDSHRESIRMAGFRRAVRDHTWQQRLGEAFRQIGLH